MTTGQIVVLDEEKMLERINDLPNQFEKAWTTLWIKDLGFDTAGIDHILISGMGGSGIAGQLTKELFTNSPLPIDVWADYQLPGWVNDNTLFIAVSYSGDTEETVDATKTALERKAKVIAITTGGKLEELSKIHGFPLITIDYKSSPREAVGYLYGTLLTLLTKLKLVDFKEDAYFQALKELKDAVAEAKMAEKAEDLVMSLTNKVPLIITQQPLVAVGRRFVTQFNENSKSFAASFALPEACHNTIVGLDFSIPEKLTVLYLESNFAFSRNNLRKRVIQKIFENKEIPFTPLSVRSGSPLAEQWLLIYFGDLLSYYLAGVYGVDPSPIESIDFLKTELKKA